MQIRCQHCHRPFGLGKENIHAALDFLVTENLGHYNVNCPHCGKSMRVSRAELQRAAPEWMREQSEGSSDQ